MGDTKRVKRRSRSLNFGPSGDGETDVVGTDAVLVKPVACWCDRTQAEQAACDLVDHTVVQEAERFTGGVIRVGRHLVDDGEPKHVVVERP